MTFRWRHLVNLFVISLLAITGPAMAAAAPREPQRWSASGKWVVNFGEERCIASRPFKLADKMMTLGLERRPMSDSIRVFLQAPGRTTNFDYRSGQVRVGSQTLPINGLFVEWSEVKGHVVYSFTLPETELVNQGPAFDLSIKSPSLTVHLPLGSVPSVLKSLGQCLSLFLAHWGLSVSAQLALATFPEPVRPIPKYFSSNDYPSSAISRLAIGIIEARLMVLSTGVPADCKIICSSGHPDLDQATCKRAMRVRFKPAVDRAGMPMLSPFFFSIRWMIPG